MRRCILWAGLLVAMGAGWAHADEAAPSAPKGDATPERRTLEGFGTDHPSCHEWTDGCAVCVRRGDGTLGCSLPGIACTPAAVTCSAEPSTREPKAPDTPKPADTPPPVAPKPADPKPAEPQP